jgi:hypothetical protein
VVGTTNAGNIDPVTAKPVQIPGPTIADRLAALEAKLDAVKANSEKGLDDVKSSTQKLQSALAAIGTGSDEECRRRNKHEPEGANCVFLMDIVRPTVKARPGGLGPKGGSCRGGWCSWL